MAASASAAGMTYLRRLRAAHADGTPLCDRRGPLRLPRTDRPRDWLPRPGPLHQPLVAPGAPGGAGCGTQTPQSPAGGAAADVRVLIRALPDPFLRRRHSRLCPGLGVRRVRASGLTGEGLRLRGIGPTRRLSGAVAFAGWSPGWLTCRADVT